ncbi:MAG: CARDB domain-containing protein [Acidobacteriota bacterium]
MVLYFQTPGTAPASRADLVAADVTLSKASLNAGGQLGISLLVRNQGTASAPATTARARLGAGATVSSSDVILGDIATAPLQSGGMTSLNATVTIPLSTVTGTYRVFVTVDDAHVASQSDLTNDTGSSPDLQIVKPSTCSVSCVTSVPSTATVNVPVTFVIDQSSSCPLTAVWDFGDGDTSVSPVTSHTYVTSKTFTWRVTATAPGGSSCNSSGTVNVGAGNSSTLAGYVRDAATGAGITGANVSVGGQSATSQSGGRYQIGGLSAGNRAVTVSANGYLMHNDNVALLPNARIEHDFLLTKEPPALSPIAITSIRSKYGDHPHFLDGVSHNVTFTVNIYWGGHTPGSVQFLTPKATKTVQATGASVTASFDVGTEIGACQKLTVRATSADGTSSQAKTAPVVVMSPPPYLTSSLFRFIDRGDDFEYYSDSLSFPFKWENDVGKNDLPDKLPYYKDKTFSLGFKPEVDVSIDKDGEVTYGSFNFSADSTAFDRTSKTHRRKVPVKAVNISFEFAPRFELRSRFDETACRWGPPIGAVGLSGGLTGEATYRIPSLLYLVYVKLTAGLKADLDYDVATLKPFAFKPLAKSASIKLELGAGAGFGYEKIFAVEVNGNGDSTFDLVPEFDTTLHGYLAWRITAVMGWIQIEHKLVDCTFPWATKQLTCTPLTIFAQKHAGLELYPRDYLERTNAGEFLGGAPSRSSIMWLDSPARSMATPIQSGILPLAQPSLSNAGTNSQLVWITDDASRSALNRGVAITSKWNGSRFTDPVSLSDDGTPDSNPAVQALSDGSAFAAWEDESQPIPESVSSISQITAMTEISAARYDPAAQKWNVSRLTANGYFDHAPTLAAASSSDVLLTWLANPQNVIAGGLAAPDEVWWSVWKNSAWTPALRIAALPGRATSIATLYSGAAADVVVGVDANAGSDGSGRELYRIHYDGAKWSVPQQLTFNSVSDDSPALVRLPNGQSRLMWLSGGDLLIASDFNMNEAKRIATLGPGGGVADFRAAVASDGRIAVVWTDVSGSNTSDIWVMFYDSSRDIWGSPAAVTADGDVKKFLTAAFDDKGQLVIVFVSSNAANASDLSILRYRLHNDLAVGTSVAVEPSNVTPGSTVDVTVTIENRGDSAVGPVPVAIYVGDSSAGQLLASGRTTDAIPANGASPLSLSCVVPAGATRMTAVVDPQRQLVDEDLSNNAAAFRLLQFDRSIEFLTSEVTSSGLMVRLRVMNRGAVDSDATDMKLYADHVGAQTLGTISIPRLSPGASIDVSATVDRAKLAPPFRIVAAMPTSADDVNADNDVRVTIVPLSSTRRRAARH